jgi:hypothetical protein
MSDRPSISSLKAVFRFPGVGPDARSRFILGCVLVLAGFIIPIIPGLIVAGYALRIMRQAINGEELHLPAWDQWSKLIMDGLRWTIISIVYFLPGFIAVIVGFSAYIGGIMASVAQSSSGSSDAGVLAMFAGMGVYFIALAVGALLFMLAAIPLPIASAHFVAKDNIGAAFCVREWWPLLKVNKLGYFVAWVVIIGLYSVMSMASMVLMYSLVLCIAVPFALAPAGLYLSVISAALFGQTYRDSQEVLAPATKLESSPAEPAPNDVTPDMATD